TFAVGADEFSITIDGEAFDSRALPAPTTAVSGDRVTFTWKAARYTILTTYDIAERWIAKQVSVVAPPGSAYRVNDVRVWDARLGEPIQDVYVPKSVRPNLGTGDYGGAIRLAGQRGLLAVVQNPFLEFSRDADAFAIHYKPDMEWRAEHGPFISDRGLLAPYRMTGRMVPDRMIPEWRLDGPSANGMDEGEIAAFTNLVRSFLLYRPEKPLNLMVGWCVNDYQIDVALPEGRTEYKRIIDRAAELGADHLLFAPSNSALSRREDSKDDWSWEHTLWLGLGQKIRKGEWDPRRDAVPDSVREMLDYAKQRHVKLVAYVYPVVPFSQNPEWLVTRKDRPDRSYASLGVRSLQDWLIAELVAFQRKTGVGGFAFDHTFLTYDGTSRYAQWAGWRRVMEEVRKELPDIAIDGRQAYHLYGPWSWLAGSYPHPTFNDEQPESFVPFPDLHFDRVSADRQRYTAYRYRVYDFAPNEIVPGFANHQTSRGDDTGEMPEQQTKDRGRVLLPLRARDWDYLGWRYSLLSSIATAGWNNILNMIPARDPEEFKAFSEADRRWFRRWIDWTAENKELLRHTRPILGAPALGKVDGTSAIVGIRGFVFLFNPNGRRLQARVPLDASIGIEAPGSPVFALKELYPIEGRMHGVWKMGDVATLALDGGSAAAFELQPIADTVRAPTLLNVAGTATIAGDTLALTDVRGEPGTSVEASVLLPPGARVARVTVNGEPLAPVSIGARQVTIPLRFAGERFSQYQPIVEYDPASTGGRITGAFRIPQRIFDQLAARRKAWPIPWTSEDFRTTWLVPERLLLFVQIAEPDANWEARLSIDGRTIELKKAYSAVRAAPRTFVGFYADLSSLSADREYRFELELPVLKAGQLQGVYFENVEPEYTTKLVR
ncbi:MAG TPA: hypothetical protein VF147_12530, partial [Vicinamibacterales bacterium]